MPNEIKRRLRQKQKVLSQPTKMSFFPRCPPEVLLRQAMRGAPLLRSLPSVVQCASRTYKAAVCTKFGQPLEVQDQPMPSKLEPDQVLVSVHGWGINFADILTCKGQYQVRLKPPFIPGSEIAGKVTEVGADVTNVSRGDRVFVMGVTNQGGAAEYCVANSQTVIPVPDGLDLINAASTIVSYGTAMMALTHKAKLKKGETVLVTAAAGATGLAATDIARNLFDCEVIAVCGGLEKCKFMEKHGATKTIDYTNQTIKDKVKEFTNGKGVNVAVDQVGGDTLLECVKSLGFEGRALTVGYASGNIPSIPANQLLLRSASLIGVFWGSYAKNDPLKFMQSISQVLQAVEQGKIKPYCGKTFGLHEVNEAFQYILDRKSTGKVVIKIRDEED